MEKFLLISHILCGGTVLLLGLVQILRRKGNKNHIMLGRIYVGAMWWICLSAWGIILFYRFSAFLMVIAVLTFYASFSGVRVLKRKEVGTEKWYDWFVAALTLLFGLGLMIYAVYLFLNTENPILAFLCFIFGFFTLHSGFQDLRFFIKKPEMEKTWWIKQHIGAMGGSYIAAITAFAVQNPNLFMPNSSYQWLLWLLPSAIGSPLFSLISKKWVGKMGRSVKKDELKTSSF
ncbi:hypothetical protein [Ekhidna sp.]|uniref:hypothetical protein n=1 Tax=Ekhidna sp. TaxID=2608089 RepID=UPI003CCC11C5